VSDEPSWDIKLKQKGIVPPVGIFDNSNNQTLEDLKRLQKIFSKNPNLCVWDLQGLVAEDGQLCG
jgi:hypothetical protein